MNNCNTNGIFGNRRREQDPPRRTGCGCGTASQTGGCSNRIHARGEAGNNGGGCGCGNSPANTEQCRQLMRRLQTLDFAINEIVLYLDVYPDCSRALDHFHRLRCERAQVIEQYEALCAPVRAIGNQSSERWDWTASPWPWQLDFVGNDKGQL
ncbi:MAG: spore coat protein CotJB [Clostridia bacterium]|nr:spore coat protein CotJB [Clostridia bacterium]